MIFVQNNPKISDPEQQNLRNFLKNNSNFGAKNPEFRGLIFRDKKSKFYG